MPPKTSGGLGDWSPKSHGKPSAIVNGLPSGSVIAHTIAISDRSSLSLFRRCEIQPRYSAHYSPACRSIHFTASSS